MNCLAGTIPPDRHFCGVCEELHRADLLDGGFRREDRFSAAREEAAERRRVAAEVAAAAAGGAAPPPTAPPRTLKGKKKLALAGAWAAASAEADLEDEEQEWRWLARNGWEDYGSEGFSRPPPELFGYAQVHSAVLGGAEYYFTAADFQDVADIDSEDLEDDEDADGSDGSDGAAVAGA
jgi:hypothetical protein